MRVREQLEEIDEHGKDLTAWEIGYVNGMLRWTDRGNSFVTPKQEVLIDRIFRDRVPEEWR